MWAKPAGVILAGGRATRMGGVSKALVPLCGKPLLAHVIDRLQPQLDSLMISSDGTDRGLGSFGLPLVPDLQGPYRGPLTGLYSSLKHLQESAEEKSLVLCPCDAPFVPEDLVTRLLETSHVPPYPVVAVSWLGTLQPTFSLWHSSHLDVIQDAVVGQGCGGLKQVLQQLPHVVLEWATCEPPPFYNVNTPGELKAATGWLSQRGQAGFQSQPSVKSIS